MSQAKSQVQTRQSSSTTVSPSEFTQANIIELTQEFQKEWRITRTKKNWRHVHKRIFKFVEMLLTVYPVHDTSSPEDQRFKNNWERFKSLGLTSNMSISHAQRVMGISTIDDFLPKYMSMLTRCPHLVDYLEISTISKPEFTLIIKNKTSSSMISGTGETPVITNATPSVSTTFGSTQDKEHNGSLFPLETFDATPNTVQATQNLSTQAQSQIDTGSVTTSTHSNMSKYFQTPYPVSAPRYYVVVRGFIPGIYSNYEECVLQTEGFPNSLYNYYSTRKEAELYFEKATSNNFSPASPSTIISTHPTHVVAKSVEQPSKSEEMTPSRRVPQIQRLISSPHHSRSSHKSNVISALPIPEASSATSEHDQSASVTTLETEEHVQDNLTASPTTSERDQQVVNFSVDLAANAYDIVKQSEAKLQVMQKEFESFLFSRSKEYNMSLQDQETQAIIDIELQGSQVAETMKETCVKIMDETMLTIVSEKEDAIWMLRNH